MVRGQGRHPWIWSLGVVLLSAPAILSFGTHVIEHRIPLGFTRGAAGSVLPQWAGAVLLAAAFNCAVPTWCAVVVAVSTATWRSMPWSAKSLALLVAAVGYVSMRAITAVLHSCWGEAPHALWW